MPFGYLLLVLFIGFAVLLQLIRVPRNPLLRVTSFWTSLVVNEQPHWFGALLLASTALAFALGDIDGWPAWVLVFLALAELIGLLQILLRSFPARRAVREAISSLDPGALRSTVSRRNFAAAILLPFGFQRRKVRTVTDIPYGTAGRRNLLDLYLPRDGEVTGPTLIYLHGGGFKSGDKKREGRLALYHLAAKGWICISANYRLSPSNQFPDYPIDLKKVIAWAKSEGSDFGVDPDRVFLAGGSAGGHIAATAGLTVNDSRLQPGFEDVDTSVAGVIGIYGYFGGLEYGSLRPAGPLPSSPGDLIHPGAPPFLLLHGDRDTVVSIGNARSFADGLKTAGVPVTLAELPGAQHTFDLLRSIRNENSIDAIQDFAGWVENRR